MVSSTDPDFITQTTMAHLRRKNRLMRAGRVEEAGALAKCVRHEIKRQNEALLQRVDTRDCKRGVDQSSSTDKHSRQR